MLKIVQEVVLLWFEPTIAHSLAPLESWTSILTICLDSRGLNYYDYLTTRDKKAERSHGNPFLCATFWLPPAFQIFSCCI